MPEKPTIFHQLLDPNTGADKGRPIEEITIEGFSILGAASDT